jgi:hypothetical protein
MGVASQSINAASTAKRHDGNGLITLVYTIDTFMRSLARPIVDKRLDGRLGAKKAEQLFLGQQVLVIDHRSNTS